MPALRMPALRGVADAEAGMGMPALHLAGPGFRDSTRLAASNLDLLTDILLTNRDPILAAIDQFQTALAALKDCLLREDEPALRALLTRARTLRLNL